MTETEVVSEANAAKEAVEKVETDLKTVLPTVISDLGTVAEWTMTISKALKENREATDARMADMQATIDQQGQTIASLKDQLDSRPKSASTATETELDVAKLAAINEQADRQQAIKDPFWSTTYVPTT